MVNPNLFILGAGKCGTTSLYELFSRHEDIHVSRIKEPSFFCRYFQVVSSRDDYFKLFDSDKKYRVDASHVYFSNPESAQIISDLFPDARFIVILRDPKARAHSLYRHMRRAMHTDGRPQELIEDFNTALVLEKARFESVEFFDTCRQYFWNFMYMRSSIYDGQLERYLKLYKRERFLIMSLAELHNDPDSILQSISEFLQIDKSGFGENIPIANAAPSFSCFSSESASLMDEAFGDLTDRINRLVGRPLDWSI
jgi:hypothetical protein